MTLDIYVMSLSGKGVGVSMWWVYYCVTLTLNVTVLRWQCTKNTNENGP
jgi:hypothetical protein